MYGAGNVASLVLAAGSHVDDAGGVRLHAAGRRVGVCVSGKHVGEGVDKSSQQPRLAIWMCVHGKQGECAPAQVYFLCTLGALKEGGREVIRG